MAMRPSTGSSNSTMYSLMRACSSSKIVAEGQAGLHRHVVGPQLVQPHLAGAGPEVGDQRRRRVVPFDLRVGRRERDRPLVDVAADELGDPRARSAGSP